MSKTKTPERKYADIAEWLDDQPEKKRLNGALRELHRLIKHQKQKWNDPMWWHAVGTYVARFVPKDNRHYRDGVIELLADDLQSDRDANDWKLPNVLYRARNLVHKYKSRKAVEELGRERNVDNEPLTHLHISILLTVKDDAQRQKFLERCLEESWSALELRRQIQNATGRKRGTGGRSPSPPKYSSAGVALRDITVMANRWTAFHKVWFVGWKAPSRSMRAQDQDENTLQEIEKAKEGLKVVGDDVEEALKKVQLLERQVKSKLSAGSTSRRAKSKKPS